MEIDEWKEGIFLKELMKWTELGFFPKINGGYSSGSKEYSDEGIVSLKILSTSRWYCIPLKFEVRVWKFIDNWNLKFFTFFHRSHIFFCLWAIKFGYQFFGYFQSLKFLQAYVFFLNLKFLVKGNSAFFWHLSDIFQYSTTKEDKIDEQIFLLREV